jgi:putative ABC transport system permease protein
MTRSAFRDLAGMAFRNLGRHRVKTAITTTAVAVSVALYIFMDAWLTGMNLDSRRNIVSYETGAAKIQTAAYFAKKDELPMYENFSGWEAISAALAGAGYDAAPRFVFSGTLLSRAGTAPIVFNAIDPELERRVLRYPSYLEAGRFPRPGALELAVGSLAADKLRLGIPGRPTREELEDELASAARTPEEEAFVRSMYGPPPAEKRKPFTHDDRAAAALDADRLALRRDAAEADLARLWEILAASGRMDVRISTAIDIKAAPETVRRDKFETELLPRLSGNGLELVKAAYAADPATGDYFLAAQDARTVEAVLEALVAADYPGAVRHVNQLIDAVVVGVVNSPNPKTNGNVAYLPLDSLQDESGLMLGGKVTELLVRRKGAPDAALPGKSESAAAVRAALGPALPEDLAVHGWLEYVHDYIAASRGDNVSSRIMILMLFLLSFIGIANTMLMAILERTKETGMLRALGMTDGQVMLTYVLEAAMVGAIGSLAGIAVGCAANVPMVAYGVDYSEMARQLGGDFGYRIVAYFRSAWNPPVIALTGVVATLTSAAAAVLPTLRALRMPVTESLRFE